MAEVNKSAAWDIEGVVPAVGVFVLLCLLDPLKDLEEGLELYFAVGEVDLFQATLVTLTSALGLSTAVYTQD